MDIFFHKNSLSLELWLLKLKSVGVRNALRLTVLPKPKRGHFND